MKDFLILFFAFCFSISPFYYSFLQADPIEIAEQYRDLLWFVNSENVMSNYTLTGNPQDGYTEMNPCDWIDLINEYSVGMPYHYGGRDDFDQWEEDYVNGIYGPGGHSVHYPGSLGWASGIDCSGFVGRCWEIDDYTLHMYFNTTYIANNYEEVSVDDLQPGDCFVKTGIHTRLFYEWGEDNNVITIEATSGYYNRVLQLEYNLQQDILNQGYVLRRNVSLNAGNVVLENEIEVSNYPNPFNPSTTISFSLTTEIMEDTELIIYNLKGQKVKVFTFPNGSLGTSEQVLSPSLCHPEFIEGRGETKYSVIWDGDNQTGNPVSSGIYLYRLKAGDVDVSRKCLLLR